jgi:Uma2 family endonuclease
MCRGARHVGGSYSTRRWHLSGFTRSGNRKRRQVTAATRRRQQRAPDVSAEPLSVRKRATAATREPLVSVEPDSMSAMPSTEIDSATARDHRVRLHGVTWDDYQRLLAMRGPKKGALRIAYLEGEVELMSPGERHESVGRMISRLLAIYALARRVPLNERGSTTWRRRLRARGVEADESYVLGSARKTRPDLAIEVVITSPGIDKLAIYHGLGVPEVWIWRSGRVRVHVFRRTRYRVQAKSELLPDLDLDLLLSFIDRQDQTEATADYWRALGGQL